MDDYKKIRAGKHKYKGKYKDYSKVIPKNDSTSKDEESSSNLQHDKTFSKRGMTNNWDRYERNIDDAAISDEDISSKDFKLMADAPISKGNYFQFKQDKQFFPSGDISVEVDQLFDLDLRLISSALSTIPLYDLIGIDKNIFSETLITKMDKTAETNLHAYNKYLETYNKVESHFLNVDVPGAQNMKEHIIAVTCADDIPKAGQNNKELNINNETQDLEDWLDDILN